MKIRILAGLLLAGLMSGMLPTAAQAGPEDVIRAKIKQALPDAEITAIKPSPVAGLYQVTARNYEPVLASADGRYLIQGEVLEVQGNKIVNVTDQSLAGERKERLAALKPTDMVIFPAVGKTKASIYVFTDVDCGYCRKLHQEVPELNQMGIEVRYLAFPRSGPKTTAAAKMDNVWCAKDRQTAMTQSKKGIPVAPAAAGCKSPVSSEYQLGVDLGVNGTPAIFTTDGMQIGGYVPADQMAKTLGLR